MITKARLADLWGLGGSPTMRPNPGRLHALRLLGPAIGLVLAAGIARRIAKEIRWLSDTALSIVAAAVQDQIGAADLHVEVPTSGLRAIPSNA